jgi:hypothetical protein
MFFLQKCILGVTIALGPNTQTEHCQENAKSEEKKDFLPISIILRMLPIKFLTLKSPSMYTYVMH